MYCLFQYAYLKDDESGSYYFNFINFCRCYGIWYEIRCLTCYIYIE